MARLGVIAAAGLGLCVVCLGAAAMIAVPQWSQKDWDSLNISFNGMAACRPVPGATATTRQLEWPGDDRITIAVPGTSHYQPGGSEMITASGDPDILAHLRVHHHSIGLDCQGGFRQHRLDITLPGRVFHSFTVAGSGMLELEKIDQPSLALTIAGSGNIRSSGKTDTLKANIAGSGTIEASGQTDRVELKIAGSGDALLGQLAARTADIDIAGSGSAVVAPQDAADVKIAGSGDVRLATEPKQIDTKIFGSGRILHGPAQHED